MKKIITISREFGSGGRTIGKAVAQKLGYAYYDIELVNKVAKETGFDPQYIEETGEFAPGNSRLSYAFSSVGAPDVMNGMSPSDFLWTVQRKAILDVADEKPCVIVGRCADYILGQRDDVLNVFIHADMEYRSDRIVKLYGETDVIPTKRLAQKDKRRKANYKHYTGQDWGMSQNYDITLNSGHIGEDKCVELIAELAKTL